MGGGERWRRCIGDVGGRAALDRFVRDVLRGWASEPASEKKGGVQRKMRFRDLVDSLSGRLPGGFEDPPISSAQLSPLPLEHHH